MVLEAGNPSAESQHTDPAGFLTGCLVEGDSAQVSAAKGVRRRALILSLLLQAAILAVLLLVPLFGRTERIALANVTPVPPYYGGGSQPPQSAPHPPRPHPPISNLCTFCAPSSVRTGIKQPTNEFSNGTGAFDSLPPGPGPIVESIPGGIPAFGMNSSVQPRPPADAKPAAPRLKLTNIEPAMLIHRVEPIYPPLARQMRRAGRVELHAIIATDGTIQSLQVASGDPLFYQSAIDAVKEWRYRPTILNGQPFEVETYITVIYTLQ